MQRKDLLAVASLIVASLLITVACSVLIPPTQAETDGGVLPSFSNYNQVRTFVGISGHQQSWTPTMEMGASDKVAASAIDDVRYSDTNVQVEGVGEADSVKTDGQYFYLTAADSVSILNAYPAGNLSNVSKISMRDALSLDLHYSIWINGIYIAQQKLVVIASVAGPYDYYNSSDSAPVTSMIWRMPQEKSVVAIFSLIDIASPTLIKSFGVSGYPITSRMSGDFVYVLAQQCIYDRSELIGPKLYEDDASATMAATSIHYDPRSIDISSFVNVMAVDIQAMESNHTSVLAGYTSTVYMSHSSLFLTFQKTEGGGPVFMNGNVFSSASSQPEYTTSIYRIDVDGLSILPAARGEAPGWLLNQFSMDEKDGYLRVATTSGWSEATNDVYVLDANLNITGRLEDLAVNERIFASRFIGDMLYLVTFRQVDPLFVINLTDPANPRLVGELKVPGFSAYLHPVDASHLIGVGMLGSSVKVSLFDVSDPEHPSEVSNLTVPGWSSTQALWDYTAVLYDPEQKLLVLPITSVDNLTWHAESAAYLFKVNGTEIETAGILTVPENEYIMRAHYIGEVLYTIT
ncbi:MAG: beta-propeller domain-containing protein, partial [Methanomassiliicoccales archaeon]|nr:beta-propeller domain-containing protein [Methanomassiliicoccales archaeon]